MRASATICASSRPAPGDREVLDRPLGLRRPEGVARHPHLAHRVVLDAVGGVVGRHQAPSPESGVGQAASPEREAPLDAALREAVLRADDVHAYRPRPRRRAGRTRRAGRPPWTRGAPRPTVAAASAPPSARACTAGRIGAMCAAISGGSGGASGPAASIAACTAPHRSCAEHDDERHAEHRDGVLDGGDAEARAIWPAFRITNRSPRPWSKSTSAATRESLQPRMAADGFCPSASSARRSASCRGCCGRSSTKRALPSAQRGARRRRGSCVGHGRLPSPSRPRAAASAATAAASARIGASRRCRRPRARRRRSSSRGRRRRCPRRAEVAAVVDAPRQAADRRGAGGPARRRASAEQRRSCRGEPLGDARVLGAVDHVARRTRTTRRPSRAARRRSPSSRPATSGATSGCPAVSPYCCTACGTSMAGCSGAVAARHDQHDARPRRRRMRAREATRLRDVCRDRRSARSRALRSAVSSRRLGAAQLRDDRGRPRRLAHCVGGGAASRRARAPVSHVSQRVARASPRSHSASDCSSVGPPLLELVDDARRARRARPRRRGSRSRRSCAGGRAALARIGHGRKSTSGPRRARPDRATRSPRCPRWSRRPRRRRPGRPARCRPGRPRRGAARVPSLRRARSRSRARACGAGDSARRCAARLRRRALGALDAPGRPAPRTARDQRVSSSRAAVDDPGAVGEHAPRRAAPRAGRPPPHLLGDAVPHPRSAPGATRFSSSVTSGTTRFAASVGVEARRSATSSSSGRSFSCPIALTTGVVAAATARSSRSSLKPSRFWKSPPPRAIDDHVDLRVRVERLQRRRAPPARVRSPCTAACTTRKSTLGQRSCALRSTSFSASESLPVIRPMRCGRNGSAPLARRVEQPLRGERARAAARAARAGRRGRRAASRTPAC